MYWGQISVATGVALLSGYLIHQHGRSAIVATLFGMLAYVFVRWAIAWVYRIRYWYSRGRTDHSRSCPNCSGYIYRQSGDWVLRCKRCGWTVGWPVFRWFTRSVPARQFRRTVVGPRLVLFVILVALLASGSLAGVSFSDIDGVIDGATPTESQELQPGTTATGAPTSSSTTPSTERGYDNSEVREAFLTHLNDERAERGLQNLTLRSELTAMGEAHAANMAKHDYIGHEWPDGTTIEDRYRNRGLLPECRLEISGSDRYYPGAENAAGAWVDRRFSSTGGSYFVTNEAELGQALFHIWLNSPPHRRAMLVHSADEMGLGLNITSQGKVYAALELC